MRTSILSVLAAALILFTAPAFATSFDCTKSNEQGANTETIAFRDSSQGAVEEALLMNSSDNSYQLSFDGNKLAVGLLLNGERISSIRAIGDARTGVAIMDEGLIISCKPSSR